MSEIDKKLLKKRLNFKKLLNHLHITIKEENSKELWAQCPLGHQRKRVSWSINYDKSDKHFGIFYCFSCGWSGNWLTLVKEMLDLDNDKAFDYVKALFGLGEITEDLLYTIALEDKKLVKQSKENQEKLIEYEMPLEFSIVTEENSLYWKYLMDRQISSETARLNQIMFCDSTDNKYLKRYEKRIIIPINMSGIVNVSFFARSILSKEKLEKLSLKKGLYPPSPPGSPIRLVFYGWDEIDDGLNYCILVEGPIDKLRLESLGYKNTLACLGNQLSNEKKYLLKDRFKNKIVYVMPDGDDGGLELKEHCRDLIYDCEVQYIKLPNGTDPGDVKKKDLLQAIANRKKLFEKEVEVDVNYKVRK